MSRSRNWLGTWNNFPENWKELIPTCGCIDYACQLEKAGTTGKEHVQFAVKFKEAKTMATMKKLFDGAHLEPAKNWIAAKQYCMKEDTRIEAGPICKPPRYTCKDPLEGKTLRKVQQEVIDIINSETEDRLVHWFHDPIGNAGKTTLAKHVIINNEDAIYLGGKASDMKYGVMKWLEEHKLRVVMIDLTRSVESFVSYQGIEEVKNGIFFNVKFECGMVVYDNPHVIVFANFMPEMKKLSHDRWVIHNVSRIDGDDLGEIDKSIFPLEVECRKPGDPEYRGNEYDSD